MQHKIILPRGQIVAPRGSRMSIYLGLEQRLIFAHDDEQDGGRHCYSGKEISTAADRC